jgi:hypothetical protein
MKRTARKLKVYRTSAGFYDAYVAAPTQKAAIEAWGADPRTFARGDAEVVTDPALMAEPLARPGEVIRKKRGGLAEQLAALGPPPAARARAKEPKHQPKPARKQVAAASKPKPKPSREPLDRAQQVLDEFEIEARRELAAIREREAALARERRQLEQRQAAAQAKLARTLEAERDKYESAVERWRQSL